MSRTRGHDGVGRKSSACACGRCSGFKALPRALDVEGDLAAIDHLHWSDVYNAGGIDHADPWWRECDVCGSDITFDACNCSDGCVVTPPLVAPLAALARHA